jgi:DNA polymerase III epsilon subunit-like protein
MSAAPAIIVAPPPPPKKEEMPDDDDKILQDTTQLPPPPPITIMDKQDRKRLKKLRKRATNFISEGEKSGLLTRLEWLEFQTLAAVAVADGSSIDPNCTHSVGPSIARRKKKEANKVEGTHHRDLVAWFMDRICHHPNDDDHPQLKKKRARSRPKNDTGDGDDDDDPLQNPTIPSWASIHNAATIENLVVLEVQVSSSSSSQLLEKCQSVVDAAVTAQSAKEGGGGGGRQRTSSCLHLPTKWFQGHAPKAMSDSLFYFVANSTNSLNKRSKKGEQQESGAPSMKDQLMRDLEEMILPLDQWSNEGYPLEAMMINKNGGGTTKADPQQVPPPMASLQDYDSIPLNESKEFVAKCGFRIEHQKEDDTQLFISSRQEAADVVDDGDDDDSSEIRVFGMDCEMVLTSLGSELARITLVEFKSFQDNQLETTTVLDALVKPENPVKDYVTRHSGITAELLEPVSTRLVQIQVALRQFLRPTDILVGHSLENDLMAAHYIHPRVIDTSLIFRHRNKRTKSSLRHMSAYLLKKTIQQGSHCSQEDAEATLELAIRRAWLGDGFALPNTDERKSILEKWNGGDKREMKMVCIGPPAWLQTHVTNQANAVHALGYESIPECKKAVLAWTRKEGPRKAHLTWCNLNICDDDAGNEFEAFQQLLVCTILLFER